MLVCRVTKVAKPKRKHDPKRNQLSIAENYMPMVFQAFQMCFCFSG